MSQQTIAQAIQFAMHQRGVPYTWGGTTRRSGFDCSGLVYRAYNVAGYHGIGRTTYDQIKQGVRVNPGNIQPGDIVFTEGGAHEGLYIGNGRVISAPHTGASVHVLPLNQFGQIYQVRRLTAGGGGVRAPAGGAAVGPGGLPIPRSGSARATAMNVALLAAAKPLSLAQVTLPKSTPQMALEQQFPALQQLQSQSQVPQQAVKTPTVQASPSPIADTSAQLEGIRQRLLGVNG